MIGKYEKKRRERKALLKELESIKSLLDDGELIDDDYSDLAKTARNKTVAQDKSAHVDVNETLLRESNTDFLNIDKLDTDLPETIQSEPEIPILQEKVEVHQPLDTRAKQNEAPSTGSRETNAPAAKARNLNSPKASSPTQKKSQIATPPAKRATGVLPGQQSLFGEKHSTQHDSTSGLAAQKPAANTVSKSNSLTSKAQSQAPNSAMATTQKSVPPVNQSTKTDTHTSENPFLPQHIRERLNGIVDIPAFDLNFTAPNGSTQNPYRQPEPAPAVSNPLEPNKPDSSANPSSSANRISSESQDTSESLSASESRADSIDKQKQAIVDSMVSEYMPKIEAQLRQRIEKMLDNEKNK